MKMNDRSHGAVDVLVVLFDLDRSVFFFFLLFKLNNFLFENFRQCCVFDKFSLVISW